MWENGYLPRINPEQVVGFRSGASYQVSAYLDGVTGSDRNTGVSSLSPLRTYDAFTKKFPQRILNYAQLALYVAGVNGFGSNATAPITYIEETFLIPGPSGMSHNNFVLIAPNKCLQVPTTGPATAALDAGTPAAEIDQDGNLAPGTGKRTRFYFTAAAPGWTTTNGGDFLNSDSWLRVRRAGNDVIPESQIAGNGSDYIDIDIDCASQILDTDIVTIVRPSAYFTGPVIDSGEHRIIGGGSEAAIPATDLLGNTIKDLGFIGRPNFQDFIGGLEGCSSNGAASIAHFISSQICMMQCKWQSATAFYKTNINRFQGSIRGQNIINSSSQFRLSALSVGTQTIGDNFGAPAQVGVHDGWSKYRGSALRIHGTGSVLSALGSNSARIYGNLASNCGIHARYGGRAIVNPGVYTQIKGTAAGSALRVGASAVLVPYGTAAGAFEDPATWNGNFRRTDGSLTAPLGDGSQIISTAVC